MVRAFKYRIYPTEKQKKLIEQHIGSVRFVYNLALETKRTAYIGHKVNLSCFDLMKQLTELKKDLKWLNEVNAQSLQQPIKNLDSAFTRFFKGMSSFPVFKKKSNGGSFHVPQDVKILNNRIFIPKFKGGIKANIHRDMVGELKSCCISKTPTGKYYASIICESFQEQTIDRSCLGEIGIDLGLKSFITTSDGEIVHSPKFFRKSESKISFLQRKLSKHKGKKTRLRLAKKYESVSNKRKDFLHKLSSRLIRENQSIAIEDLNVKGMIKNRKISKSIQDSSWSMFVAMLEYKSKWRGVDLIKIGRFEPSSKTCSSCGSIKKELHLSERVWVCNNCGQAHDRDINAAINIKKMAACKKVSGADTKTQRELPTMVGAKTFEKRK